MQIMIRIIIFLFVFIPVIGIGQTTKTLSEILWSRVKTCYSMFEDMNDDGIPDFDKIDDSENGYLKISGSWPACGCSCSSTVGAFKNNEGNYVILQLDIFTCSWEKRISSNKELNTIMPNGFGINCFITGQITERITHPIFFMYFEIPRFGTDTKVRLELVPFGLKPDGNNLYCYEYKEKEGYKNCKSVYGIKNIAEGVTDLKTIDYLLTGDFDKICKADKNVIQKYIGSDDSRFKSIKEIQEYLKYLKIVYNIYQKLEYTELILGWDRQNSRFFIKEKRGKPEKLTFIEFLIKSEYWSPAC